MNEQTLQDRPEDQKISDFPEEIERQEIPKTQENPEIRENPETSDRQDTSEQQEEPDTGEVKPVSKLKRWRPYLIWLLIGLAFAVFVMVNRGIFKTTDGKVIIRTISDGLTISGMVLVCIGVLILVAQKGAFDALRFSFGSLVTLFRKDADQVGKYRSYSDYKKKKGEKEGIRTSVLVLPGACLALLGILFTGLYYL